MKSRFHSIFLAAVAAGAIGLAIGDSITVGFRGFIGFAIGFGLGSTFLSLLAVISDIGKVNRSQIADLAQSGTKVEILQHLEQESQTGYSKGTTTQD